MTYKDRARIYHPEIINNIYNAGIKGCPDQKDINGNKLCRGEYRNVDFCKKCWNREVF